MIFNATYDKSKIVVEISRDLQISFPEIDMEYEIAYRAMGGRPVPVEKLTDHWNAWPVTIVAGHLGLPWEVLSITLLNYVEHIMPIFRATVRDSDRFKLYEVANIEDAVDITRDALSQWGSDDFDSNSFFHKSKNLTRAVMDLASKFNRMPGMPGTASEVGANMAWATACLLKYMVAAQKESLFILGASKARTTVFRSARSLTSRIGRDTTDRAMVRKESQERDWQVRRAMDVAQAFRDVEAETPEGEHVDLGRVMELAGKTR